MSDPASFDREQWLADLDIRRRDLELRERDQTNRDAELALKTREQRASAWRNPLTVAIIAAAVAAAGNAVVAVVNGRLQRALDESRQQSEMSLERSKAEGLRILEMIKTGDPERAAANVEFLLQSGLLADEALAAKVGTYLKNRQPGSGPALPSPSGRLGFERSDLLTKPLRQKLEQTFNRYFQYLDRTGFPKPTHEVSVSVEAMGMPNAYYQDNVIHIDARIADDASVALREYNHHILTGSRSDKSRLANSAIESGLADYLACSFLDNPNFGEMSAKVFDPNASYIRSLTNRRIFPRGFKPSAEDPQSDGEIWGGFFWDLRASIGETAADSLLSATWQSFVEPRDGSSETEAFLVALEIAAKGQGKGVLHAFRAAADARKLRLRTGQR